MNKSPAPCTSMVASLVVLVAFEIIRCCYDLSLYPYKIALLLFFVNLLNRNSLFILTLMNGRALVNFLRPVLGMTFL